MGSWDPRLAAEEQQDDPSALLLLLLESYCITVVSQVSQIKFIRTSILICAHF